MKFADMPAAVWQTIKNHLVPPQPNLHDRPHYVASLKAELENALLLSENGDKSALVALLRKVHQSDADTQHIWLAIQARLSQSIES